MNQQVMIDTLAKINDILKGAPSADFLKTLMGAEGVRKDYPTGLVGYDLEPAARVLQPVITPLRNRIPRVKGKGGTAANWRQITSLDTNKTNTFSASGTKAPVLSYTETDRSATYKTISMGDNVSLQAIQQAIGLEDARANMSIRLLENVMILEEQDLITARNGALGTVTAPTVTSVAAGGTVAANTYYVVVRACTGQGRTSVAANITAAGVVASRGKKSTQTAVTTTGAASVISATTPAVDGAAYYEWYVGTTNNATSETLEAITSINSVSLAAIVGTGGTVITDNSADSNAFDGLLSQGSGTGVFGNFGYSKTMATGTAGVGTTFSLTDIDTMLLNLWKLYGADPDALFMSPQQAMDFTAKCRAAGLIRAVVDNQDVGNLVGGQRVTKYKNPITGKDIDVVADPWWFDGMIAALSFTLPAGVPLAETRNAYEVKTQLDYFQLEYGFTAPKYEIEVLSLEALAGYFLLGTGILVNIANG